MCLRLWRTITSNVTFVWPRKIDGGFSFAALFFKHWKYAQSSCSVHRVAKKWTLQLHLVDAPLVVALNERCIAHSFKMNRLLILYFIPLSSKSD